jgi:hypothetical protein
MGLVPDSSISPIPTVDPTERPIRRAWGIVVRFHRPTLPVMPPCLVRTSTTLRHQEPTRCSINVHRVDIYPRFTRQSKVVGCRQVPGLLAFRRNAIRTTRAPPPYARKRLVRELAHLRSSRWLIRLNPGKQACRIASGSKASANKFGIECLRELFSDLRATGRDAELLKPAE